MELELAEQALDDARFLLEGERLRAAANRAYYAMFHAALTALDSEGVQRPRTHTGVLHLFREHLARTGRLDSKLARDFQVDYDLRHASDYASDAPVQEDQVRDVVQNAATFIEEVKRLLGQLDA